MLARVYELLSMYVHDLNIIFTISYIASIQFFVEFSGQSAVVSATGFVGTLTLKGERMVVLVTNNHVFQTLKQARKASYQFGYQSGSEKWQPKKIQGDDLIVDNESFFFTHHVCRNNNYVAIRTYNIDYRQIKGYIHYNQSMTFEFEYLNT